MRRVLRLKFQLGIFENPYGDPVNGPYRLHTPAYTALANQASREAMTLLKNDGVLPMRLNAGDNIVVAGPRATDGARLLHLDELLPPGVRVADHAGRHPGPGGARPG